MDGNRKKVILITGASSGMGKATALKLIEEGHVVYGAARRVEKMQDLVDKGGHALKTDMTDHDSIVKGVELVVREQGRIDVLVNNAGYAIYGAVEDTTMEDARRQLEVNLFGLAAITKEVLPLMRKRRSGKIINITSMGGKIYTPLGAWYHASKHALEGWSDCLRIETKQFGIDVVVIEPGLIATEFGEVMFQPMMDRSGKGPYANIVESLVKATEASYKKKGSTSPAFVIANIISKAVMAKKPKTRYVGGKMARPLMFMRKYLGDRIFDKAIMSQVKS
jgi:NAD(P)-dependent dehydrogenase (short-subunit alcohol dehydrogenase family)